MGGPVHQGPHCGNLAGLFHWGAPEGSVFSPPKLVIYPKKYFIFSYVDSASLAVMILGIKQQKKIGCIKSIKLHRSPMSLVQYYCPQLSLCLLTQKPSPEEEPTVFCQCGGGADTPLCTLGKEMWGLTASGTAVTSPPLTPTPDTAHS